MRELFGLQIHLDPAVYRPAEDSLLLAEAVQPPEQGPALDLCTGTGLAALRLAKQGASTVATDANPRACRLTRRNARENQLPVHAVCTDLAAGLEARFEAIACNPPYLPTDDEQAMDPIERALAGGPRGHEVTRRVLDALPELMQPSARAWLVVSTRQPVDELQAQAREAGLTWTVSGETAAGRFERLQVVELERGD